jgi:hypothetical protein
MADGAKNCWEFMQCGRGPNGYGGNIESLGDCPAATEARLDGCNEGHNAGRACWAVAGTLCRGEPQGTLASKSDDCRVCPFYHLVLEEETPHIVFTSDLLKRLKDDQEPE